MRNNFVNLHICIFILYSQPMNGIAIGYILQTQTFTFSSSDTNVKFGSMIGSMKRVQFIDMHMGITTNVVVIFGKVTITIASSNCLLPTMGSYFVLRDTLILIFIVKIFLILGCYAGTFQSYHVTLHGFSCLSSDCFIGHAWVSIIFVSITWVVI